MAYSLRIAIDLGKRLGKTALYWGCWESSGHFLHKTDGRTIWNPRGEVSGFPWSEGLLDGGLLKNGEHPDVYDGKVFWTCGGSPFWYAFFWWDNSIDHRGASNSGLYVRGFGWPEVHAAFDYACAAFPKIVARQRQPLILQGSLKGTNAVMDENNGQQEAAAGLAAAQAVLTTQKPDVRRWAAELAGELAKHGALPISFEAATLRLVRFHETGSFDNQRDVASKVPGA